MDGRTQRVTHQLSIWNTQHAHEHKLEWLRMVPEDKILRHLFSHFLFLYLSEHIG